MALFDSIRLAAARLSKREKLMVAGMVVAVSGFVIFMVVHLVSKSISSVSARVKNNDRYLRDIIEARSGYEERQLRERQLEGVLSRPVPALRSFLGKLAKEHGVTIREYRDIPAPKLKKGKRTIEEKSMRVYPLKPTLAGLARFLAAIENNRQHFLVVKEVVARRAFDDISLLDEVVVTVSTYFQERPKRGMHKRVLPKRALPRRNARRR